MTGQFTNQIVGATVTVVATMIVVPTMAEPQSGEAQVAGVGPRGNQ